MTNQTMQERGNAKRSKSYYPAPVRFTGLSSFGIRPFWIVPFCFLSGAILFLLRGLVLKSEGLYKIFHPLAIPLLIAGLALILLRHVRFTDPNPWLNAANTAGYVLLYISLFMLFFLHCGLIALWALPFDMVSADRFREEYMTALSHNPAAIKLYESHLAHTAQSKLLRFDDGLGGMLLYFKDYVTELAKNDEQSLVKRIAMALLALFGGFFMIVLIAIVFPGFCLLLPFLLAYLGCVLVDRLVRIGLK